MGTDLSSTVNNALDDIALNLAKDTNKGKKIGTAFKEWMKHYLNNSLTSAIGYLQLIEIKTGTNHYESICQVNDVGVQGIDDVAHLLNSIISLAYNNLLNGAGTSLKIILEDQLETAQAELDKAGLDPSNVKNKFILDGFSIYKGIIEGIDTLGTRYDECAKALEIIEGYKDKKTSEEQRIQDLFSGQDMERLSTRARIEAIMQLELALPYKKMEGREKFLLDLGYENMVNLDVFSNGLIKGSIISYIKKRGSPVTVGGPSNS